MDCWINGLLQIKELCKSHHMGRIGNAYFEIFLKIQHLWLFLNSKPIIHKSINPSPCGMTWKNFIFSNYI